MALMRKVAAFRTFDAELRHPMLSWSAISSSTDEAVILLWRRLFDDPIELRRYNEVGDELIQKHWGNYGWRGRQEHLIKAQISNSGRFRLIVGEFKIVGERRQTTRAEPRPDLIMEIEQLDPLIAVAI